jgi:hypothetical protein
VEPERGKPEMKWNFLFADTGMVTHEKWEINPDEANHPCIPIIMQRLFQWSNREMTLKRKIQQCVPKPRQSPVPFSRAG